MRTLLLVGVVMMLHAFNIGPRAIAQTPEVIEAAAPGYPRLPSGGHEAGEVRVELTVSPEGSVTAAKATSGPDRLRAAAETAALRWKFAKQDQPVTREVVFAFIQRLELGDPPPVAAVFKSPTRMEIFAEEREVVTIADPQMVDVEKERKQKERKQRP